MLAMSVQPFLPMPSATTLPVPRLVVTTALMTRLSVAATAFMILLTTSSTTLMTCRIR